MKLVFSDVERLRDDRSPGGESAQQELRRGGSASYFIVREGKDLDPEHTGDPKNGYRAHVYPGELVDLTSRLRGVFAADPNAKFVTSGVLDGLSMAFGHQPDVVLASRIANHEIPAQNREMLSETQYAAMRQEVAEQVFRLLGFSTEDGKQEASSIPSNESVMV